MDTKIHAIVDAHSGLPLSWVVATARDAELPVVPGLLDKLAGYGIRPSVAIADKGYAAPFYDGCEARNIRPVVPLRERTPFVKQGEGGPAEVRPRDVDVRRFRRQARRGQVSLPLC